MQDKNPDNNESRRRLIECAKREFLEKGFVKASLRKIASDAGLTTGAVYFFFSDKNGLLEGVVGEALGQLNAVIDQHFAEDIESDLAGYRQQDGDHDAFTEMLVNVIYDHYDEMTILLDRSAGSKYEDFVDVIINRLDSSYIGLAEKYAAVMPGRRVNKKMLHWLTHVQINAFVHMMQHEKDKESALHFIKPVMDMLIKAWMEYSLEDDV
ncbi:MAG: TetR/AcrR family transcriptional regulator [Oscillospiraceae bacterium]|nr:TetR/AcrR family transcriptional regulator [Oscillospiraceae bacterium]